MRFANIVIVGLAGAVAAGCTAGSTSNGSFREQIGLAQRAPDEFLIIARKPIEVPVKFELERPRPGAPSRVEVNPIADAHTVLFQRPEPPRLASASDGEQVLLRGADLEEPQTDIRAELGGEEPEDGERQYGLTSLFGVPIPANVSEDDEEDLDSVEEVEALRRQGVPTPAAPPPPPKQKSGTILFLTTE